MTAFNAELNVMGMSIAIPEDPAASPGLKVNLTVGQLLPLDSGDGTPLQVPIGSLAFSLNKEAASKMGEKLIEEAEKMPEESKLTVASPADLANVQQAADVAAKMKANE